MIFLLLSVYWWEEIIVLCGHRAYALAQRVESWMLGLNFSAPLVVKAPSSARRSRGRGGRPASAIFLTGVASPIRCRGLRAAIGAQRKAHRAANTERMGKRGNAAMRFDGQRGPTDDR